MGGRGFENLSEWKWKKTTDLPQCMYEVQKFATLFEFGVSFFLIRSHVFEFGVRFWNVG